MAGKTVEWSAEKSLETITYRIGQMTVTINRDNDGDLVFPKLVIEHLGQTVEVKGATAIPEYAHQISAVVNSGQTLVLFESFSGGAHCCVQVSVVGIAEGKLRLYDFGGFDGSRIPFPSDVSGDGVADFVISDDRFLYSFAPYAYSIAPSRIFNIRSGKVVQVSDVRKFEKILLMEMRDARKSCVNGTSGYERNGACPAYLALASRVGRTQVAWNEMIGAYDASVDWELPTGCLKKVNKTCGDRDTIHYKSYPEALLAFLKDAGYIGQSWLPKAAKPVYQGQDVPDVDFGNTT